MGAQLRARTTPSTTARPIRWRWAAATGWAMVLTSLVATATPAAAADLLTVPLPQGPAGYQVRSASGDQLVAWAPSGYDGQVLASADGGTTWAPSPLNPDWEPELVFDGQASWASGTRAYTYSFAGNAVTETELAPVLAAHHVFFEPGFANATHAVASAGPDLTSIRRSDGAATPLLLEPTTAPSGAWDDPRVEVAMGPTDHLLLVSSFLSDAGDGEVLKTSLDPVPLTGEAGGPVRSVTGEVLHAGIEGRSVEFAVRSSATRVSRCTFPLTGAGDPVCSHLTVSATSEVWVTKAGPVLAFDVYDEVNGTNTFHLFENGAFAPVGVPAESLAYFVGEGRPSRPLLFVESASGMGTFQVLANGTLERLYDEPQAPVQPLSLELGPDLLAGLDERPSSLAGDYRTWYRSVSPAAIGPAEGVLPDRASKIAVSGGRMAAQSAAGVGFFDPVPDRHKLSTPTRFALSGVSGPYWWGTDIAAATDVVRRVDLSDSKPVLTSGRVVDVFGSLVLERQSDTIYRVTDVSTGDITGLDFTGDCWESWRAFLWGDWVAVECVDPRAVNADVTVYSWRSGDLVGSLGTGDLRGLADGVALVETWGEDVDNGTLGLWDFRTGATTHLPEGVSVVALGDDRRVAYATDADLVVREIAGAGQSAPRILGVAAPTTFNPIAQSWSPQLDTTKALQGGSLVIAKDGATVRTLTVPSTSTGAVRGIGWDGKDDAGNLVAAGAYTWELVASAADGTGAVQSVAGGPATGTVGVSLTSLGTVSGVTPKISDTTPTVGQTLTAVEGPWSAGEQPVTFSFAWYRGSSTTPVGTDRTYLVQPGDAGAQLKVKVTGQAAGHTSVTKTSALSATVAKGRLAPTPIPTIDDLTPTVDAQVTAQPGTWGPDPVTLKYQWYKVSSSGSTSTLTAATSATYLPRSTDVGYRLKVKVTGSKAGFTTVSRTSPLTGKVMKAAFGEIPAPTIDVDGTPRVGKEFTAITGTYTPAATKYGYQWYRLSATGTRSTISGATAATYQATASDLGRVLQVRVKAYRSGYVTTSQYAPRTGTVAAGLAAVTPKVSDTTPKVGQDLSVLDGKGLEAWTSLTGAPIEGTYEWFRGATKVGTGRTYRVQSGDYGRTLKVRVTGTAADHATLSRTSASTSTVATGAFVRGVVAITGDPKVGETLTLSTGDWSPAPTAWKFQWYRDGASIAGGTGADFTLTAADAGKLITVKATGSASRVTTASVTSAAVGPVVPA